MVYRVFITLDNLLAYRERTYTSYRCVEARHHKDYRASLCEHDPGQLEGGRLSKSR